MKKAFSLVELSIVLVIIGILMGMTIKGKSLINSAKVKAELAIIRNIQIDYHTGDGLEDIIYRSGTGSFVDLAAMGVDSSNYISKLDKSKTYGIWVASIHPTLDTYQTTQNGPHITVTTFPSNDHNYNGLRQDMMLSVICIIESHLDDNHPVTGDGRIASQSLPPNPNLLDNCTVSPQSYMQYAYKID